MLFHHVFLAVKGEYNLPPLKTGIPTEHPDIVVHPQSALHTEKGRHHEDTQFGVSLEGRRRVSTVHLSVSLNITC
jgi:hypothetical protein